MKKMFANWKMSLSALFLVGGLMFVSNNAQAQSTVLDQSVPDVKGAGTWLVEADALLKLEQELQGPIATALEQIPNGSGQYFVWKNKALFYEATYGAIKDNVPVSKAVRVSYDHLAGASHLEPVFSALSQAEWQAILNEMVDLLTD